MSFSFYWDGVCSANTSTVCGWTYQAFPSHKKAVCVMTKIMKTNDLEVSHPHNCSSSTWPFLINYKFEAIPAREPTTNSTQTTSGITLGILSRPCALPITLWESKHVTACVIKNHFVSSYTPVWNQGLKELRWTDCSCLLLCVASMMAASDVRDVTDSLIKVTGVLGDACRFA